MPKLLSIMLVVLTLLSTGCLRSPLGPSPYTSSSCTAGQSVNVPTLTSAAAPMATIPPSGIWTIQSQTEWDSFLAGPLYYSSLPSSSFPATPCDFTREMVLFTQWSRPCWGNLVVAFGQVCFGPNDLQVELIATTDGPPPSPGQPPLLQCQAMSTPYGLGLVVPKSALPISRINTTVYRP